jgi:hypothetical protein
MRVRNKKIHLFETPTKTEKPVLFLWVFIFLLIFIGLWILMYELYKQISPNSYYWVIILWWVVSLILLLTFKWLSNGSFNENSDEKIYIRLKKWRKHDFLEKYFDDIQCKNNSNYYFNLSLLRSFKRQILHPFLWTISIVSIPNIIIIYGMYIWKEPWSISLLFILMLWFNLLFYVASIEKYLQVKKLIDKWSTSILRKKVWSYYIYNDWIYFY